MEALRRGVQGEEEFVTLEVTRGNVMSTVVLEVAKLKEADERIRKGTRSRSGTPRTSKTFTRTTSRADAVYLSERRGGRADGLIF